MSELKPCPKCEAIRNVELITREERMTMKGREISFIAKSYRCLECREEFDSAETLDSNLESAREAYDRIHKTPTREELVALRNKYGASQKAFGLLLGFGELTINKYEQGSVPDSTHRLLLRLATLPAVFREIYSENKYKIGATQRKRIEESEGFRDAEAEAASSQQQWEEVPQYDNVINFPVPSRENFPTEEPKYTQYHLSRLTL